MQRGQDPDDFFSTMKDLQLRLENMGDDVLGERFEDVILQAITNDYDYVRQTSFRVRDLELEGMKRR